MNTHYVEYVVRGYVFKTDPLSWHAAQECLKSFMSANPKIGFAVKIRTVAPIEDTSSPVVDEPKVSLVDVIHSAWSYNTAPEIAVTQATILGYSITETEVTGWYERLDNDAVSSVVRHGY